MSKKLIALGAILIIIVSWRLATTGAQTDTGEPGEPSERGPNERFYIVGEKLDQGGNLYLYVDLKGALRDWMEDLGGLLEEGGVPVKAAMFYSMGDRAFDLLGLYAVEDVGISVVKKNGYNHSKTYIRSPGEKQGLFRIIGGDPHDFPTLDYAPADTVLFRYFDLDPTEALALVRNVIGTVTGDVGLAGFNQSLTNLSEQMGFSVEQALSSLEGQFTLVAGLDAFDRVSIPQIGEISIDFPAPKFALLMKAKDDTLYQGVKTGLIEKEMPPEETVTDGVRRIALPAPPDNAWHLKPVVAYNGDFVIFASHSQYLDTIVATSHGTENLRNAQEFQAMMEGLPSAGNGMTFVSRRLPEEVQRILQQITSSEGAPKFPPLGPFGMMAMAEEPMGMAFVRVNEPEGLFIVSNGPMGGAQTLVMTAGAPFIGIMAAVTLPNFFEAQTRAKYARARSEIRNLAVCLETYYIDHNTYPPATTENGELLPLNEDGSAVSSGYVPWMLTTPISYMTSLPVDQFHEKEDGTNALYRYATNGLACWIVASHGPDKDADVELADYPAPNRGKCQWKSFVSHFGVGDAIEFDPTNGSTSSGDIMRVGP
jgi:type II secretory pathway pseudopilin PulG